MVIHSQYVPLHAVCNVPVLLPVKSYNHMYNYMYLNILETKQFMISYMYVALHIHKFIFYQEAHAMVRAAKVKQVGAEKRFKEANNKVSGNVTPLRSFLTFALRILSAHNLWRHLASTSSSTCMLKTWQICLDIELCQWKNGCRAPTSMDTPTFSQSF